MRSVALRNQQAVTRAATMARVLTAAEARRSGLSISDAAAVLARHFAVAPGRIWALLYRRPAEVSAGLLFALEDAVEREVRREITRLENEMAAARHAHSGGRQVEIAEIEAMVAELRRRLTDGKE